LSGNFQRANLQKIRTEGKEEGYRTSSRTGSSELVGWGTGNEGTLRSGGATPPATMSLRTGGTHKKQVRLILKWDKPLTTNEVGSRKWEKIRRQLPIHILLLS